MKEKSTKIFRIAVFNPYLFSSIGGAQKYAADIVNYLFSSFISIRVIFIVYHDKNNLTWFSVEDLNRIYGLQLPAKFIDIAEIDDTPRSTTFFKAKRMLASIIHSVGADLTINAYHNKHLFAGRHRIHIVHFPSRPGVWHLYNHLYMTRYNAYITNSDYGLKYLKNWWPAISALKCRRLYPVAAETTILPSEVAVSMIAKKEKIVLAYSRFDPKKNMDFIISQFIALESQLPGWKLIVAGGLDGTAGAKAYYEKLNALAEGHSVELKCNLSSDKAKTIRQKSALFWHAMGYGIDDALHPADIEHFGITTVEAMNDGIVPIVIDKGGQQEIVNHGINGYRWLNPAELEMYTLELAKDSKKRERLARNAMADSLQYSVNRFQAELDAVVRDYGLIPEKYRTRFVFL
jgi:glycosyltransferase involved in cell wall biosynthesis